MRFYLSDNNGSKIKANVYTVFTIDRSIELELELINSFLRSQSPAAAMKLILVGLLAFLSLSQLCASLDDDYIEPAGYAKIFSS